MHPFVRLGWFSFGSPEGVGNYNPNRVPEACIPTLDVKTGFARTGVFIDDIIVYTNTLGACNLPGSCQILTKADCLIQSGTYDGDGTACPAGASNLPGDCNQDGTFDLSDVVHLLGSLFQDSPEDLPCNTVAANLALLDCNQYDGIDLSDAVYKLAFLFQGGPAPAQGSGCTAIVGCPQNQGCP